MPKTRRLSDAALVRRSQQGDRRAFSALLNRYDRRLRGLAHALLLDQAEMDVALGTGYMRAWRDVVRLGTKDDVAAWLYRATYNACIDQLRRTEGAPPTEPDTRLATGLAALPPGHRVAVVLVDREGFSPSSAARIMGLPQSELATTLDQARNRLAPYLPDTPAEATGAESDGEDGGARSAEPVREPAAVAAPQAHRAAGGRAAERDGDAAGHDRAADADADTGDGATAAADGNGRGQGGDGPKGNGDAGHGDPDSAGASVVADDGAGSDGGRDADGAGASVGVDGGAGSNGDAESGDADGVGPSVVADEGAGTNGDGESGDADGVGASVGVDDGAGTNGDGESGDAEADRDAKADTTGNGNGNGDRPGAGRGRGRRARKRAKHAARQQSGRSDAAGAPDGDDG